ncbi:beta-lactamase family protein [Halostella sp. JP-L12]|uniref:serine hydrolase domain-containing protein n=1 Tax=Halostella TaxID=1843185 RepID=UPI0013CEF726|nr:MULTISPECIES: serine hydrolase domain-containing protein [Halostella]NHN48243.1 beta-lactamase family protein [Halostella sp. JP-L12]
MLRSVALASGVGLAGCSELSSGGESTTTGTTTETGTTTGTAASNDGQDRPVTGEAVPELAPVDDAVLGFASENGVPAAAAAVARDGEVVHERGYGWRDADRTDPVPPDTPFRLASVTKALTNAAVHGLFDDGALSPDTRVFPMLDLDPLPGDEPDDRLDEITVQHLLNHAGGWDQRATFDPVFHDFAIADRMDLSEPPGPRETARFMLGRPLQFDPGKRQVYSNFGYLLLGLLVERVAGASFPEHVRESVLGGVDADRLYRGASLPENRPDREVHYRSNGRCSNVMALDRDDMVPCADGGFHLQGTGAAGSLVSSTRTLLGFAGDYWITGEPRAGDGGPYVYFGSIYGTFTMLKQRSDGVDVAVLLNRRGAMPTSFASLEEDVDAAIDAVDEWP